MIIAVGIPTVRKAPRIAVARAVFLCCTRGGQARGHMAENQQGKEAAKRTLDAQLQRIEQQIHDLEGAYLDETSQTGNVLTGFDNYMKKVSSQGGRQGGYKRKFKEDERLFSRSSVTNPSSTWIQDQVERRNQKGQLQRQPSGRGARGRNRKSAGRSNPDYVYSSDSDYEGY